METKKIKQTKWDKLNKYQSVYITINNTKIRIGFWEKENEIHITIPNKVMENNYIKIKKEDK